MAAAPWRLDAKFRERGYPAELAPRDRPAADADLARRSGGLVFLLYDFPVSSGAPQSVGRSLCVRRHFRGIQSTRPPPDSGRSAELHGAVRACLRPAAMGTSRTGHGSPCGQYSRECSSHHQPIGLVLLKRPAQRRGCRGGGGLGVPNFPEESRYFVSGVTTKL